MGRKGWVFRLILMMITITMKIIHVQEKREAYHTYSMVLLDVIQEAFNIGQVDAARVMAFVPGTEQATKIAQYCHPHYLRAIPLAGSRAGRHPGRKGHD